MDFFSILWRLRILLWPCLGRRISLHISRRNSTWGRFHVNMTLGNCSLFYTWILLYHNIEFGVARPLWNRIYHLDIGISKLPLSRISLLRRLEWGILGLLCMPILYTFLRGFVVIFDMRLRKPALKRLHGLSLLRFIILVIFWYFLSCSVARLNIIPTVPPLPSGITLTIPAGVLIVL
ncbi:MAG: hypothetical protein J3Q66DRAFT_321439 [Benniella sp.]|nr:MAG: hypothetical protein J3Q66DRAFT_321439 [Benniella sp.]